MPSYSLLTLSSLTLNPDFSFVPLIISCSEASGVKATGKETVGFALVCGCCCSSVDEWKPFNQEESMVPLHRNKLLLCCTLEIFGGKNKEKGKEVNGETKGAPSQTEIELMPLQDLRLNAA